MSSGNMYWVWCEYQDPGHRAVGVTTLSETGIACGLAHNASGEDPGPTCMGYHTRDGNPPACPPDTTAAGWMDQGRPGGIGLGFCALPNRMPPMAPPKGYLDTPTSSTGAFSGWAYDPYTPSVSIFVDYHVDGPAGSGAPGFRVTADGSRPDVDSAFNVNGNHGYSFTLPAQFLSTPHTIYVYAISLFGQPNAAVIQSPGHYAPPVPPPPPPPTCRTCVQP